MLQLVSMGANGILFVAFSILQHVPDAKGQALSLAQGATTYTLIHSPQVQML